MAQVELLKRKGTYVDKNDGQEKSFTNFYVRCGDAIVPIEVVYYEGKDGKDYSYSGRKAVLSSYATNLPSKDDSKPEKDVSQGSKRSKADDGYVEPF